MASSGETLLKNRDLVLILGGNAVSLIGTSGARIAYPLIVLSVTRSPTLAGAITFASTLPGIILQLSAGVVADYSSRRRTMLLGQALGVLVAAVAATAVYLNVSFLFAVLVVAAFIEGSILVFLNLAEISAIRMVAREDQWPAAFSLFESRQPIADFAGRTLGAASFGLFSWLPFAVNAVSCLTSTASLAGVRASRVAARPSPHESGKSGLSRHLAGFHWLAGNPFLRGTLVVFGTTNVIFQIVILLVIVSIIRVGQPPWVVGAVLAATGIGGVIGSSVAPSAVRRFPPHAIIAAAVWAWTIPMMLIAISSNPYVLAAAWLGVGMVGGIASVAQSVYMAGAVPDSVLARVNGSCAMVSVGLVPFGALLGGYLLDEWGPGPVRWLLPIAMTVLAIWATRKAVSTWSKTTQVSAPSQR